MWESGGRSQTTLCKSWLRPGSVTHFTQTPFQIDCDGEAIIDHDERAGSGPCNHAWTGLPAPLGVHSLAAV